MPSPTAIPFPASIEQLAPAGLVDALSAIELGALYRLLRHAWGQDPACSLPAEPASLAMVARVTHAEWHAISGRVLMAFIPQAGRLVAEHALAAHADASGLSAKRAAAAAARWGRSKCNANAMQMHSTCIDGAPLRSSGSGSDAPAPLRPNQAQKSERLSAPDVVATLGAGARALVDRGELRRRDDQAWMLREISNRQFAWAAEDRRSVPAQLARELSEHPNAYPMLVSYALDRVDEIGRKAIAAGKAVPNPLGLLISALGASNDTKASRWDVPLFFSARWSKREADRDKLRELQSVIDRERLRRGITAGEQAGSGTHIGGSIPGSS